MPIDASIYSQLNTQPVDPLASVGRVMAIKSMMGQQQIQNLQGQQLGLSLAENMRLRDLFSQNPNATPQEVMAASPATGIGYARAISERALADAKTQQALAATQAQTVKTGRDLLASASSDADYSGWQQYMQAHGWQGDPGMPQSVNDPNFAAWREKKLMTADQLLDRLKPNYQMANLGGTSQVVQVNPNAPGAVTGPLPHTMTPGEQASNAMARAHLAVTAATADPFGMLGIKQIAAGAGAPVPGAGAPAAQPTGAPAAPGQRTPVSIAPPSGVAAPKGMTLQPVTAGDWQQIMGTDVHGDDFLKAVPPGLASQIKAYTEGRLSFPGGFALKSPYFQALMQMVGQYDPSFDAVNYNARARTRQAFTSGTQGTQINALNTVIGHLQSLSDAGDALKNTSMPSYNSIANWMSQNTGDPRVQRFNTTKKAVTDELTRVWRGMGGSESDIKTWGDQINASNSPAQLHGVISQIGDLLESKLNALGEQYKQGMGTTDMPIQLITPKSRQVLNLLEQRAGGQPQSAAQPAPAAATGASPAAAPTMDEIDAELRKRGVIR